MCACVFCSTIVLLLYSLITHYQDRSEITDIYDIPTVNIWEYDYESCVSCRFKTFLRPSELRSLIMYRKQCINSLDCNSFPIVVTLLGYLADCMFITCIFYNIVIWAGVTMYDYPIQSEHTTYFICFVHSYGNYIFSLDACL